VALSGVGIDDLVGPDELGGHDRRRGPTSKEDEVLVGRVAGHRQGHMRVEERCGVCRPLQQQHDDASDPGQVTGDLWVGDGRGGGVDHRLVKGLVWAR
jgi:hypothetical protein